MKAEKSPNQPTIAGGNRYQRCHTVGLKSGSHRHDQYIRSAPVVCHMPAAGAQLLHSATSPSEQSSTGQSDLVGKYSREQIAGIYTSPLDTRKEGKRQRVVTSGKYCLVNCQKYLSVDTVGLIENSRPFLLCKQSGLLQAGVDIYGVFKKTAQDTPLHHWLIYDQNSFITFL